MAEAPARLLPIDDLYRRIRLTAGARFHAHRRLRWHDAWSQWSVALSSVALIIAPLAQAMGLVSPDASGRWNVFQVAMAVFVLVFSLLLSRDNYALRADKMHRCALGLNRLLRRLEPLQGRADVNAEYVEVGRQYDELLEHFDNHATSDYERYLLYRREEFYARRGWLFLVRWLKAHISLALEFLPYFVLYGAIVTAYFLLS